MKIEIIFVSRKLAAHQQDWCDDYLKRLKKYTSVKTLMLKEKSDGDAAQNRNKTWSEIESRLDHKATRVLLDLRGTAWPSEEFSKKVISWSSSKNGRIQFVIGGSYGLPEVAQAAFDATFSLSKLTFPHRLALLILLEQLYRAFTIHDGHPYHHA